MNLQKWFETRDPIVSFFFHSLHSLTSVSSRYPGRLETYQSNREMMQCGQYVGGVGRKRKICLIWPSLPPYIGEWRWLTKWPTSDPPHLQFQSSWHGPEQNRNRLRTPIGQDVSQQARERERERGKEQQHQLFLYMCVWVWISYSLSLALGKILGHTCTTERKKNCVQVQVRESLKKKNKEEEEGRCCHQKRRQWPSQGQ